jgi:hypothetical protein
LTHFISSVLLWRSDHQPASENYLGPFGKYQKRILGIT